MRALIASLLDWNFFNCLIAVFVSGYADVA